MSEVGAYIPNASFRLSMYVLFRILEELYVVCNSDYCSD